MTTKSWSGRWLFAGFIATVLLGLWALMCRSDVATPSPVSVVSRAVAPLPVAAAPVRGRTTSPPRVEPVGVRQDYLVQAERVELARRAVARAGRAVTGDPTPIPARGAG